ncbi:MAG: hypothetical protein Q8M16_03865 [Pirellulaceae bacterium]|nr:hypothetical protein [Pirellulaceae bacterium]
MVEPLHSGDQQPNNTDLKTRSRGVSTDMSSAAILERLKIMSDLSRACQALGQAKRVGKTLELEPRINHES